MALYLRIDPNYSSCQCALARRLRLRLQRGSSAQSPTFVSPKQRIHSDSADQNSQTMRTTSLQQFIRLRRDLTAERETLQARLRDINAALGDMPLSSASPIQSATGQGVAGAARRGR